MKTGEIVQAAASAKVLGTPKTVYTQSLLDAIPGKAHEAALAARKNARKEPQI